MRDVVIESITPEAWNKVYVVRWRFPNGTNLPHNKTFHAVDELDAAVKFVRWLGKLQP